MLGEVALDQIPRLLGVEAEEHVDLVHVPSVQTDGVPHLGGGVSERQVLRKQTDGWTDGRTDGRTDEILKLASESNI